MTKVGDYEWKQLSQWDIKWEVVKYLDNVPESILNWRGGKAKERSK